LKLETVAAPIVRLALVEDTGTGDITSEAIIDTSEECGASIVSRGAGVLAGLPVVRLVFSEIDKHISFETLVQDGMRIEPGVTVCKMSGSALAILRGERVALNFLQRLSGIATRVAAYVEKIEGTGATILDTRKTTPGLRFLEKYAVRKGGGQNHRFGLFDAFLIKDNHIVVSGSIGEAIQRVQKRGVKIPIIAEAANLSEVKTACELGVDRVLLDNMTVDELREATALVRQMRTKKKRVATEASGRVTLKNVREIAETGVDYISVGDITHSVTAMDFSLEVVRTT
jgi:nicotinate-nucleotide pyrophosphorylase (carboxylating)